MRNGKSVGLSTNSSLGQLASSGSSIIEERRKALQSYIQELALIPSIKESHHFKQFLSIEEHFPELRDALKEDFNIQNQVSQNKFSSTIMKLEENIEEGIQARMNASVEGKENESRDDRL